MGRKARFHEYNLNEVFTFGTVSLSCLIYFQIEDFWRMFNNVYQIDEIIPNTDYLLFKHGIKPEWEDPMNNKGGKWVVTIPIEEDMEEECMQIWLQLILHMIGGHLEDVEDRKDKYLINGAIFSIRDKHYRISLWCHDNNNIPKLRRIGLKFKELAKLPQKYKFCY